MKIAVIGLGVMGEPMTLNMINHGFDVAVCDVNQSIVDGFTDKVSLGPSIYSFSEFVALRLLSTALEGT